MNYRGQTLSSMNNSVSIYKKRKPERKPPPPGRESGIKTGHLKLTKKLNDVWKDDFLMLQTMNMIHAKNVRSLTGCRPCNCCGSPEEFKAPLPKKVEEHQRNGGRPPYNLPARPKKNVT